MLIDGRALLAVANENNFAIPAFNLSDWAMAKGIFEISEERDAPLIVAIHPDEVAHIGHDLLPALIHRAHRSSVPVAIHWDHGGSYEQALTAIKVGFTSVMIDGSMLPFEENVAITRRVVEHAHAHGVSVEGELGTIGGSKDGRSHAQIVLADPDQAEDFVRRTGVDALAVAIGTSHGAYKFTSPPDGSVLHMDLVGRIAGRVPGTHLVMHGSSGLPADLRATINAHGGDLPESWGVPDAEKARAAGLGVRKINQGMDHYMAFTAGVRVALAQSPGDVDPAGYLAEGRRWAQRLLEERMVLFGQAGRAPDIRPEAATPAAR
jgi:fructose-bisphosphate aldolase class II